MSTVSTQKFFAGRGWLTLYIALLLIVAGAGWSMTGYLGDKARQEILDYNDSALSLHISQLRAEIEKINKSAFLLSESTVIVSALISNENQDVENANVILDRYNLILDSSVCYLMDSDGKTIASSNRNNSDSFVGKSYRFRPYFIQAVQGIPGRYFALGATSFKRGFYASYPVRGKSGITGVAVIKQDLDSHEAHLTKYPYCFMIDPNGIVFMSGKNELNFKSLWPVNREVQFDLLKSKQFGDKEFTPVLPREVEDGMEIEFEGKNYLISRMVFNADGWSMVLMTSTERIYIYRSAGIIVTILICSLIIVLMIINYNTSKSAEMVRKSEQKFRAVFEQAFQLVGMMTTEGILLSANNAALTLSGVREEDVIGKPFWEAPWWSHSTELQERLRLAVKKAAGGEFVRFDATHPAPDGSMRYVDFSLRPVSDDTGRVVFLVPEGRDITERRQAEDALRESEKKYRNILENIEDGYFEVDLAGSFTFYNDSTCRITGYSADEMIGMNNRDFSDENNARKIFKVFNEVYRTGISTKAFDWELIRKDGSKRSIETVVSLIKDSNDLKTGFRGIVRDVTERKRAEEALKDRERTLATLIGNLPGFVYRCANDRDWTMEFISNGCLDITGYRPDEFIGNKTVSYNDIVQPDFREPLWAKWQELLERKASFEGEYPIITRDGETRWVWERGTGIYSADGQLLFLEGFITDITRRKKSDTELDNSFKRLRAALGGTIQALAVAVETRDPYTAGHQKKVADLSRAIAVEMGLDANRTDGIRMSGVIHDLGKMGIPAEILSKPSKLTDIEYRLIKTHPKAGYDILKDVEFPWPIAQIVLQHHERYNGSGYPDGLKGDEILLEARIIGVADVVEAIASYRPYRPGLGVEKALGEITQNRGILFDPAVVDACLRLFIEKGYKFQ
jgi:PAS domain S-box-containing protein